MYFPQRRGVFENVLTGLNTVLGVANFVKGWQNQSTLQEGRELEGIANKVKLAQAINPNQPVSLNEGLGVAIEKTGIPVPRLTPERVVQTQDIAMRGAPGDVTLPTAQTDVGGVTVSTGGQATPMAEVQRRQEQGRSIAESLGPVGGYAPIVPQGKKLAIVDYAGGVSTKDLPAGVSQVIQQKKPETENWMFDREGKPVANLGSARPHFMPKPEKTAEQLEAEAEAKARGRTKGTPDIQEIDPETGLTTRTFKRRPVYPKTDTSQVPVFTEDQAEKIAMEVGKIPKGAKILKKGDPEYKIYNQARNEATRRVLGDTRLGMKTGPEQEKVINEMTDTIYQTRSKQSRTGKQQPGGVQSYQLPQNGQMVPVDKATYDAYWQHHGGQK